jgi:cytochrome c oxidase assembly protein subunit 15
VAALVATVALVMLIAQGTPDQRRPRLPGLAGVSRKTLPYSSRGPDPAAAIVVPNSSVSLPKAWREMAHRYFAALGGGMIPALAIQALSNYRKRLAVSHDPIGKIGLPLVLVRVVVLLGFSGKWTVTRLLRPVLVTLHLLGGRQ